MVRGETILIVDAAKLTAECKPDPLIDGLMQPMALVWLIFTLMLFVAEPLFLDRRFERRAQIAAESTFTLIQRLHWILLVLSLVTVFGAVAGGHGGSPLSLFR